MISLELPFNNHKQTATRNSFWNALLLSCFTSWSRESS